MKSRGLVGGFLIVVLAMALVMPVSIAQEEPLDVALLISGMMHPFFVTVADGAKAAGARFNVAVTVLDAQDDPELQTRQVEDSIIVGYDALLINPADVEALVTAVRRANEAGIPVFTVDRDVIAGERFAYIGTSNVMAAEQGAEFLVDLLRFSRRPKPWKVVMLEGIPGASSAREREEGFHNVLDSLKKSGDILIVADLTANFDRATGLRVMEDVLAVTIDIDAVIAANDEMALGALEALKGAGLGVEWPDGVFVVGFDAIDDAVEAVRRGDFQATVAQAPFIMGYWAVEAVAKNQREGWMLPEGTPIYEPTGALLIATPVLVVTWENVDQVEEITKVPPPLVP
ncbi:MAG: substrate-binding domain-containing protein [Candidatus Bipolaricaulia bacterium]